jgi:hypothetical protein
LREIREQIVIGRFVHYRMLAAETETGHFRK